MNTVNNHPNKNRSIEDIFLGWAVGPDQQIVESTSRLWQRRHPQHGPHPFVKLRTGFTGQKADSTGLLYFNARYYDSALGQFLSPDTLFPDAGVLFDYNRYLYVRGNPLKYTDPTGHYSDEALYDHFGCTGDNRNWGCVESHFMDGGSHAGLWGWLEILMGAENGDDVRVLGRGTSVEGRFATVAGKIVVQNSILNIYDEKWIRVAQQQLGDNIHESGFASLAHLRSADGVIHGADYYSPRVGVIGRTERNLDCRHTDCTGRFLNGMSTASSVVAAGCKAFVVTGPCAQVATAVGAFAGFAATLRAGAKAAQPEATSVDVIDAVMSGATTVAGGLSHPYIGPLISTGQWTYDEYISPAMR